MSREARKKEKQRLKRQKKKEAARREASSNPLRRAARSGLPLECWVGSDWRETGLADIIVFGHVPGGGAVMGGFVIDLYCVGLKDAWGRRNMSQLEFREEVLGPWRERRGKVAQLDVSIVRRLIAGALRFSRQNGFRLPPHYERWTAILGDLGDIHNADLSDFGGPDGKRLYVGDMQFLKRRLIACTPAEFFSRPDIHWITEVSGDWAPDGVDLYDEEEAEDEEEDDDDDDADFPAAPELDDIKVKVMDRLVTKISDRVRRWCFANKTVCSPLIAQAVEALFLRINAAQGNEDADSKQLEQTIASARTKLINSIPKEDRTLLEPAIQQVGIFMKQFKSPQELMDNIDLFSDSNDQDIDEQEMVEGSIIADTTVRD